MTVTVIFIDGTWSKPGARSPVAEALRTSISPAFGFSYLDYPAAYGAATGMADPSLAESIGVGRTALRDAVRACPNPVLLAAYSQGAMVARRFVLDDLPKHRDLEVIGLATLGDPHMEVHHGRSGIAGARPVTSMPVDCLTAPGDPIADLALGSPLRSIADLSAWMAIRNHDDLVRWAVATWEAATRNEMQGWWRLWERGTLAQAVTDAAAYWPGTNHTTDYLTGGVVDDLARRINARYRNR